jgi:hypothetical protein
MKEGDFADFMTKFQEEAEKKAKPKKKIVLNDKSFVAAFQSRQVIYFQILKYARLM